MPRPEFRLRSLFILTAIVAVLLAHPGATPTEARAERPPALDWERLLGWLPEDTETVIVAQGPFEIPKQDPDQFTFRDVAQLLPAGSMLTLRGGILLKELLGQKVLCAVEGSRRFTSPRGLGLMPYQGCHIVQFEPTSDDAVRKAFRTCEAKAEEKIELAGERVAVFTEKLEEDMWSFFVSQPRPGVMICATDKAFLAETLKRIGKKSESRALPKDLPEWKHVDVKAPVWAVRHYSKVSAENDPSSPLGPKAAANVPDSAAVGFVFWYNPERDNVARARYLSGAKDAIKLVETRWNKPSEGLVPKINDSGPGAVEISMSVSEEEAGQSFLFVLLAYLGHAVYL